MKTCVCDLSKVLCIFVCVCVCVCGVCVFYIPSLDLKSLYYKMAAISQTILSDAFLRTKFCILIKISLKFVPKGLFDNNPALV